MHVGVSIIREHPLGPLSLQYDSQMVTVFKQERSKHPKAIYSFGYQPNFLGNSIVKLSFYRRLSHHHY